MINKKSLWFLTLFSLILVLSVYYITMPNELLLTANMNNKKDIESTKKVSAEADADTESAELVALRVESDEKMLDEMTELKTVLTNSKSTAEEKNEALTKMQNLNKNKGTEEQIEENIKNTNNVDAFVKIENSDVTVVIDSTKHDKKIANEIMKTVQNSFDTTVNITVKFQK